METMFTMVRSSGGRRYEALILAASGDCIRAVFHGSNETAELTRVGTYWVTDGGELVEIDMLIPVRPVPAGTYLADQRSKSLSAVA